MTPSSSRSSEFKGETAPIPVVEDQLPRLDSLRRDAASSRDLVSRSETHPATAWDITWEAPNRELGRDLGPAGQPLDLLTTTYLSQFLTPLTRDSFRDVVADIEQHLQIVNRTLAMLQMDSTGFEILLHNLLNAITVKAREILGADRASVFLIDADQEQLWSVVAESDEEQPIELRLNFGQGIAGLVAQTGEAVRIPCDFYDDPRSISAQEHDRVTGYRTYSLMVLPLADKDGRPLAVIELLNKLRFPNNPSQSLDHRIDPQGFSEEDLERFADFASCIRLVIESSQALYRASGKQRASQALSNAIAAFSRSKLDLKATLFTVMDEAQHLLGADRSTLWILDRDRQLLWANLLQADGQLQEISVPVGVGIVGRVAETGQPLNIPFDLYDHPDGTYAKLLDQQTGYRTCSLLCMPVFDPQGQLIAVTQLVNKRRAGQWPAYSAESWPIAPEAWRTSFHRLDQELMQSFNIQAGIAIHNAQLFEAVQRQENLQRQILHNLSNAVISTDRQGRILTANASARNLLGRSTRDVAQEDATEGSLSHCSLAPEPLENLLLTDLIQLQDLDFGRQLQAALSSDDPDARRQYYPDQTLLSRDRSHCVNLTIDSISPPNNPEDISGALVVIDDFSDEKRLKTAMYRYMNRELADEVLRRNEPTLGGVMRDVSVLFADIRSYTPLSEQLPVHQVVTILNEYFETMVEAVFGHKGTLDKFIGDALMAVFGSPMPQDDHPWQAIQCAIEMQQRLTIFNQTHAHILPHPLKVGIGINSDSVICGNIGSSRRMEYTAIGDGVNLASRLEAASKDYGCDILISEQTYRNYKDRLWARELDIVHVRGKCNAVHIYEVMGLRQGDFSAPLSSDQSKILHHFERGRRYYLNQAFIPAMREFIHVLEINPQDRASLRHLQRCQYYMANPPGDNWQGVCGPESLKGDSVDLRITL
jgi:adenylate cyclase